MVVVLILCLQCFDTVDWASGRASGLYKLSDGVGAGVVICLERGTDCLHMHMVQLMPLPSPNPVISCLI